MRVRADDVIGEGPARGEAPQVISLWASLHIPNTTNFTFMKKNQKLHVEGLRIELHYFFNTS
jgi:hypothetical protein